MTQLRTIVPADIDQKKELLNGIYTVYSNWIKCFSLACQMGCAACCTQSVSMTSLEGEVILDFIKRNGMEIWLSEKLAQASRGKAKTALTMNQFADACLKHREIDGDSLGSWDFAPCVFLEEKLCSIYEVRPFGCRSFGSLVQCAEDRAAEMESMHLAVNTVFTQIIEHLSSDGGYCSNMTDILLNLKNREDRDGKLYLLLAQPIPGFLLEPNEVKVVKVLLQQLSEQFPEKGIFGDLIDNFLPIL
jgi:Fe-S-cluster containining protein